jgi:hypothetical protein
MANNFQECAHLEVDNTYQELRKNGGDALALIFNMQKSIQEDVYGYNFDDIQSSIGKLKEFIDWNDEALRDENREFHAALTGIHTYPNCWKPWKSKHKEAMARPFSALTPEELKELQYEKIDELHFFCNTLIAIGLTPELITNYYVAKNAENVRRQQQLGGY